MYFCRFAISNISGSSANFGGSAADVETYYAVYPQAAAGGMASAGVLTATLPSSQMVLSGTNTAQGALVCVGQGNKASGIAFKNVFGRLAVTVTRDDITKIVVLGNDIAGTATFNSSTGAIVAVTAGEDEIELLPPSGSSTFDPGTYYVAVLPGTTPAADFKVAVKTDGLNGALQLSSKDVVIPRNGGFNFGELDTVHWGIHITSKAELFAWNAAYESWTSSDVVYLDRDIDMELDAWTPRAFSGIFEGQNHSLTHLNVPDIGTQHSGFFNTLSGTLRNITFGADGDGSIIKIPTAGDGDTWHYAGAVGDVTGSGTMSYVTNWATIEVTSVSDSKTRIGGIAGRWNSSGTMSHCVNRGAIHNYANTASQNSYAGGLIGLTDSAVTISDSDNYGDITIKCPTIMGVGGIMGNGNGKNVTVQRCSNHGDISLQEIGSGTAANHRLGGILGASCTTGSYTTAYTCTLDDCHNYGSISSAHAAKENSMGGMIGYMCGTNKQTISVTDCSNEAGAALGMSVTSGTTACWVGGIIGHMPADQTLNVTLTRCINRADFTNDYPLAQDVAGISGYINGGTTITLSACKNYGNISSTAGTGTTNQSVGGIVARVLATKTYVDKCENHGNISFDNASNTVGRQLVSGVVAWANQNFEITDCINTGDVTINTNTSNNYCYAGAIISYTGNGQTIATGNKASGTISCNSAAATATVGGLFGRMNKFKTISGNKFYGTVSSGGVATVKAGALIGMLGGAYTISSSTICDAVTVDGVTYAAAAVQAAWLCPANSGTVDAPTVDAHSGSEI